MTKEGNEKIFALFTVVILFIIVGIILGYISFNNKRRTLELQESVAKTKINNFKLSDLTLTKFATSTMWEKRDSHTAFLFKDKMWVLGGLDADLSIENGEPNYDKAIYYNDIWYTADGFNWIQAKKHAEFPLIRSTSVFDINGKLFMVGGYSPDSKVGYNTGLWTSIDGINWSKENTILPWPIREGQKVIKFKNQYLLIGGVNYFTRERFNDVWSSNDGYNWKLLTKSAPWEPRWDMEVSDFNGKLWLTGGMTSVSKIFGDEWVSEDGINWRLVYENAPFGKRQGLTSVILNKYLVLIGGIKDTNDSVGEIWGTVNGIDWVGTTTSFVSQEDSSSLLFKNKIWILGGMNYDYRWTNNIYYSNNVYPAMSQTKNSDTDEILLYPGNCPTSNDNISSEVLSKIFVNQEKGMDDGFIPGHLVNMSDLVKTDEGVCLDKLAGENLVRMFSEAEKDGIYLGITYGYRSPEQQQELFNYWTKHEGLQQALEGIAKPYHSEHQLGVAVDLSGKSINYLGISKKFANTPESEWLKNNSYIYGFVLSYPEDKVTETEYIYEPWHYRYVGSAIARILHSNNITFTEYKKDYINN